MRLPIDARANTFDTASAGTAALASTTGAVETAAGSDIRFRSPPSSPQSNSCMKRGRNQDHKGASHAQLVSVRGRRTKSRHVAADSLSLFVSTASSLLAADGAQLARFRPDETRARLVCCERGTSARFFSLLLVCCVLCARPCTGCVPCFITLGERTLKSGHTSASESHAKQNKDRPLKREISSEGNYLTVLLWWCSWKQSV